MVEDNRWVVIDEEEPAEGVVVGLTCDQRLCKLQKLIAGQWVDVTIEAEK